MAELIARFYSVDGGAIFFNGEDLASTSAPSFYARIAFVSQEAPLFSGSFADNIAYGCVLPMEREALTAAAEGKDFLAWFVLGLVRPYYSSSFFIMQEPIWGN